MEHQASYMREGGMTADMDMDEHMEMMENRRLSTLWCHLLNVVLGVWVFSSPFVFGYLNFDVTALDLQRLAAERDIPEVATRAVLMTWSDLISGTLVVLFSVLSLKRVSWTQWAVRRWAVGDRAEHSGRAIT